MLDAHASPTKTDGKKTFRGNDDYNEKLEFGQLANNVQIGSHFRQKTYSPTKMRKRIASDNIPANYESTLQPKGKVLSTSLKMPDIAKKE